MKLDPKKMMGMMKQLGISQEEVSANKVIIEKDDGNIIINNPSVVRIDMKGQESFQISGDFRIEDSDSAQSSGELRHVSEEQASNENDVKQVMEKTGKSEEQAKKALEQANGDLAEAILNLS